MTRILITGAAGFLGRRLTAALLLRAQQARLDADLLLVDRTPFAAPAAPDAIRIETRVGDVSEPAFVHALAGERFDSLFHLAAPLTLDAERDPAASFRASIGALTTLLAMDRPAPPKVVFASSVAVFGRALPETVDDTVRPTPETTYGTHKAMAELLLADFSRRGRADARCLRLPIVLVRPGSPTPAVSDRIAALIRDPFAGRTGECPLDPATRISVASAGAVVRAFLRLHNAPADALPANRAMNLPSLSVTLAEIIAAVERRTSAIGHIRVTPDAALQRIVDGWPRRFASEAASALGLAADADMDAIIDDYLGSGAAGDA